MNITINDKAMAINTIEDLARAQGEMLVAFAQVLIGTKEAYREEFKGELYDEVKEEFMNDIAACDRFSYEELRSWIRAMDSAGYLGLDEDEIEEKATGEALKNTDYSSVEEMQDVINDMQRAMEEVHDAIYEFI